jgi:hypothetical protein
VPGGCSRTSSEPGRPPITISVCGVRTARGSISTLSSVSNSASASAATLSRVPRSKRVRPGLISVGGRDAHVQGLRPHAFGHRHPYRCWQSWQSQSVLEACSRFRPLPRYWVGTVPAERAGTVSGVLNTCRQLGGALARRRLRRADRTIGRRLWTACASVC